MAARPSYERWELFENNMQLFPKAIKNIEEGVLGNDIL
jgi:hypothetical protein